MNLLTDAVRLRAFDEVKFGKTFCLSLPLDYPGGRQLSENRNPPIMLEASRADGCSSFHYDLGAIAPGSVDVINDEAVLLHPQYSTQWDSLAHFGQRFDTTGSGVKEQVYYNGFRAKEHVGVLDNQALGIDNLASAGVQGRGVLVDLYAIYGNEKARVGLEGLQTAITAGGATIRPGDFLCIRTGLAERLLEMGKHPSEDIRSIGAALDGRDEALLNWIDQSGIVAICADNPAVERVSPRNSGAGTWLPLHELCLFKLGIHLGELWWFGELATWLAEHGRTSFLLTAPPLRLPGAAGSPVTPLATV
jgi:kynurenine formamidase